MNVLGQTKFYFKNRMFMNLNTLESADRIAMRMNSTLHPQYCTYTYDWENLDISSSHSHAKDVVDRSKIVLNI